MFKFFPKSLSVVVVQLPSHVQLFAMPWTAEFQASLSIAISQSLFKLMSMETDEPGRLQSMGSLRVGHD